MGILPWLCSVLLLSGSCQAFPFPFLWPSSFTGGTTTTTTTTTTHGSGPPHPHAQNTASITTGSISPAVLGQPQSSHLHVRPASIGPYLTSRPLPPLVGVHHHHQHRPVSGPNSHLHVHGGAISGSPSIGHRHHYHNLHQQPHHHHHHHSARVLHHSHVHPAALHFPLHA